MRTAKHYRELLDRNPSASVGFSLAAAAVYAAQYGFCEAEQHGTDEFKSIARQLRADYGENLSADEVRAEMDLAAKGANRTAQIPPARVTPSESAEIASAAEREGLSVSEFVRRAALAHARQS